MLALIPVSEMLLEHSIRMDARVVYEINTLSLAKALDHNLYLVYKCMRLAIVRLLDSYTIIH